MDIIYLGHACFKLRGKAGTLVIDPYTAESEKQLGMKLGKVSADVVVSSHDHGDHNGVDRVEATSQRPEPFIVSAPGEYEVQGISIFGTQTFHDDEEGKKRGINRVYAIHIDEVVVVHLGDLGHVLGQKQIDKLNGVDVLLVPVGGVYTIDPERAVEVINQIEPSLVIPMHFKTKGMSKTFEQMSTLSDFLKKAGSEDARREDKLVLTKGNLPEDREIVVLQS